MGKLAEIELDNHGIVAFHNMPCAICGKELATYYCNLGVYQPCWKCQKRGWNLTHKPKRSIKERILGRNRGARLL